MKTPFKLDIDYPSRIPLLIAAVSGRAMACAAHKMGIPVYVLDLFNDIDTQGCTVASRRVKANGSKFDAEDLLATVEEMVSEEVPVTFGAGFESCPELLEKLAEKHPLYGNSAEVVKSIKDPARFFPLLERLGIPHPMTRLDKPELGFFARTPFDWVNQWLVKTIGGTGGSHVRPLTASTQITDVEPVYYQQQLPGKPHSVIFLANGQEAKIVGYNEQWHNESFADMPYLYEGAVSVYDMPLQDQITDAVQAIVAATGLRGLCGMDLLLNASGFHVLEINPRPSASFELHQVHGNLFYWHLKACLGELPDNLPRPPKVRAHAIMYARAALRIPAEPIWTAWTADHPEPNSIIPKGNPICTVFAQGAHSQQRVRERQQELHNLFKQWIIRQTRYASKIADSVNVMNSAL